MRWAKIDTRYMLNEKVRAASSKHRLAPLVHLAAILYSAENLTDGLADEAIVLATSKAPRAALTACIDAGLLTRVDADTVRVHDYDDWQTPAEVVNETKRVRSRAGRAGAEARWGTTNTAKWQNGKPIANDMANGVANEWLEHRTKNIEQERENDVAVATSLAPDQLETLTGMLSDALRARSIPHRVTASWDSSWERLVARYGYDDVERVTRWAMSEPFWVTTATTPAKLEKHWDTIYAQAARDRTPASLPDPVVEAAGEPPYPSSLLSPFERDAWRVTWLQHIRSGMTPDDAAQRTNNDMGLQPDNIINIEHYA